MPKRKLPWVTKEERRRMEILRGDLQTQLAREKAKESYSFSKVAELETGLVTIERELEFDN